MLNQISPFRATYPTSRRSILILFSHLGLGLPSGLLPPGFPTNLLHVPLLSPIRTTCSTYLILLVLITHIIFGEQYKTLSIDVADTKGKAQIFCNP